MASDFIDLNRSFIPVKEGEEPSLELTAEQGLRFGGWLDWKALLVYQRVVLLAEAGCGKTAEFRHQTQSLRKAGHVAFFARVEDLDEGINHALEIGNTSEFTAWKDSDKPSHFFLDSLDEARLSRKRFDKALRCLAQDIGEAALSRAHVFVSCRVSDWCGDNDRAIFEGRLPLPEPASTPLPPGPDSTWATGRNIPAWKVALLAPLDEGYQRRDPKGQGEQTSQPSALLIVQLAPLDKDQQRVFLHQRGIHDADAFMDCLHRKQLEPLAQRPGDLQSLAEYWRQHRTLHSLHVMSERAIQLRLRETNPDRRGQDSLSYERAREGAERLAAGLVLGKSFALLAPDREPGQSPDNSSVDAVSLLPDWTDADQATLLLRGLFAPATYGRIRFYHRWAQEYLAACWLRGLLRVPGNRKAVRDLLFAARYGVETSVPNLRPVTAWLALWDDDIRAELIRRVPFALIQYGDPTALPVRDRAKLLRIAAHLHKAGQIADDGIDYRDLTLFADPALAPVIREIWQTGPRRRFCFILLRLIREAAIKECVDIAREVALDDDLDQHNRSVAIEALSTCDEPQIIEAVLPVLLAKVATLPAQVATTIAECFFPKYMSIEQLLKLIDDAKTHKGVSGNFDYILLDLFNACPDITTKLNLAEGICQLCLTSPLVDTYYRVGKKHRKIAERLTPIARNLIRELKGEHHPALSAIMLVIQRCKQQDTIHDTKPIVSIGTVLSDYPALKQTLFWDAATETANEAGPGNEPTAIFQIEQSFEPGPRDLEHFLHALTSKPEEWQKRLALDAAIYILKSSGSLRHQALRLRTIVADHPVLKADLTRHLFLPLPRGRNREIAARAARREADEKRQTSRFYASWVKFRGEISAEPKKLCDSSELSGWGQGVSRLWRLTEWLGYHTREVTEVAVLAWPALTAAFGQPVADAYTKGIGILWRSNEPKRPYENGRDKITCMGYAAIGVEAKDNPAWATRLTAVEAERAASYACLSAEGCPFWFDALLNAHPEAISSILVAEIEREMRSTANAGRHFLSHYARVNQQPPADVVSSSINSVAPTVPAIVTSTVVDCLEADEPATLWAYNHALAILNAPSASLPDKEALFSSTMDRLKRCTDDLIALRHLALLFTLAPDDAIGLMEQWISEATDTAPERAALLFGELLNPHHPDIPTPPLATLSTTGLEMLLRLVYHWIRPEADNVHEGGHSMDTRDYAESARNNILRTLLYRPGPEAHAALLRVGNTFPPANQLRFMELALEMAERDSNPPPWKPSQVIAFEQKALLPARNGDELLAVITGILEDIQHLLGNNDASPRAALRDCKNEDGVQRLLAYELTQRAHGRYSVTQETVTDRPDRMDILVQATTVPDQLVIEVKHGDKGWTAQQLLDALEMQLGGGYLRPSTRRHGILVVTNHSHHRWNHPTTKVRLPFSELITMLQAHADKLTRAQGYARTVKAFGLDAAPDNRGAASRGGKVRPPERHTQAEKTQPRVRFSIRNPHLLKCR